MPDPRYCRRCGVTAVHPIESEITGGQWVGVVILLLLGVLPGLFYLIYLGVFGGSKQFYVCPNCGARRMSVPANSPLAPSQMNTTP
jgi:hypothetical protein